MIVCIIYIIIARLKNIKKCLDPVVMWLLAILYAIEALFFHSALLLEGI